MVRGHTAIVALLDAAEVKAYIYYFWVEKVIGNGDGPHRDRGPPRRGRGKGIHTLLVCGGVYW